MWAPRTPEEEQKWHELTAKEARSHGLIAGAVWIIAAALAAAGWMSGFGRRVIVQRNAAGSYWTRLAILAVVVVPAVWYTFRRQSKHELAKLMQQTICPQCDTSGDGNAGSACPCGGTFVAQSTMK